MALLFCDGFDHYEDGGEFVKWDQVIAGTEVHMYPTSGRGGLGCMRLEAHGRLDKILTEVDPSSNTFIFGAALDKTATGYQSYDASYSVIKLVKGLTTMIHVHVRDELYVQVKRGDGTLLATSSVCLIKGKFVYFELKVVFDAVAGSVEVRADGTTVALEENIDTVGTTGYTYVDTLQLGPGYIVTGNPCLFDDLVIMDGSGTKNNDFLGDVLVRPLYPVSDGSASDFTPSTGTDHFALVDDPQVIDTSTNLESVVVGDTELFNMSTFESPQNIFAVQITVAAQNILAGGFIEITPVLKSGTTPAETLGVAKSVPAYLSGGCSVFEEEPVDGVDWTEAEVNAMECGVRLTG